MAVNPKILNFEYLLSELIKWHDELLGDLPNDLSKIKVLKLMFFVSAVDADNDNEGLLDIFDEYYALPYGPVESEVYNSLENLQFYNINRNSTVKKDDIDISFENESINRLKIKSAVDKLKSTNPELIKMKPFDLVELSHKWSCWSIVYDYALKNNTYAYKIPTELIKAEKKVFSLKELVYEF